MNKRKLSWLLCIEHSALRSNIWSYQLADHLWHNINSSRCIYVVSPALSDYYAICVIFRIDHDSPPKSIRIKDFSEASAKLSALNMENKFISCSPPLLNPNEYADHLVN